MTNPYDLLFLRMFGTRLADEGVANTRIAFSKAITDLCTLLGTLLYLLFLLVVLLVTRDAGAVYMILRPDVFLTLTVISILIWLIARLAYAHLAIAPDPALAYLDTSSGLWVRLLRYIRLPTFAVVLGLIWWFSGHLH